MSDDGVGYRRPPKKHQWQPGQSGNKSGRPKRKATLQEALIRELARLIVVTENGKKTKMPMSTAIAKQLVRKAASGDLGAFKQCKNIAASGSDDQLSRDMLEMFDEDRRLLDELKKKSDPKGSDGSASEDDSEPDPPCDPQT